MQSIISDDSPWWCKIGFVNFLTTITGTRAVYDHPSPNGLKYYPTGLIFVILQTIIRVLVTLDKQERFAIVAEVFERIMYSTVFLHIYISCLFPTVIVIGTIIQFNMMTEFLKKVEMMDIYFLSNQVDLSSFRTGQRRFAIIGLILILGCLLLSAISTIVFIVRTNLVNISQLQFIYYLSVVLIVLRVCIYFNDVFLRFEMFNNHLKDMKLDPIEMYLKILR